MDFIKDSMIKEMISYFMVDVDNMTQYIKKAGFLYNSYNNTAGGQVQANKIGKAIQYMNARINQAKNFMAFLHRELNEQAVLDKKLKEDDEY